MSLSIKFNVHGISMQSVPVKVEYEGKPINAMVDCLEVELTSDNPRHGNPTLRFVGEEIAKAQELIKPDGKVIVTIDVEAPSSTKKAA